MTAALLPIALKSMVVAGATLGFLRLAARRSAAERSIVAHLGLCALLALPLADVLLPSLSVFVPERLASKAVLAPVSLMASPVAAQSPAALLPVPPVSVAAGTSPAHWARAFVLGFYLAPAILLLLFMCAALMRLFGLRAHAAPVADPVWRDALVRAQSRMGFTKRATLLSSGDISSPISWGLIHPTILINRDVLAAHDQAEAIIAHELAHVMQHDWAKLILARIATAVFWFNPLAWMLAREAHQLREEAADDAVLAADIDGPDYASLLIGVARRESHSLLSVAHGVAPSRSSLRRRITRVLDDGSMRAVPGKYQIATLTVATLVATVPLATLKLERTAAHPHGIGNAIIAASVSFTPAKEHDAATLASPQSATSLIKASPAPKQSVGRSTSTLVAAPHKHRTSTRTSSRSATSHVTAPAPVSKQPDAEPVQSQVALDALPQMLRKVLDAECVGKGGTPGQSPNLFRMADLNGDGVPDLVFDRRNYECTGAASPMGSSRYGTTLTIFVGGPANNVSEVYTGSFEGSRVENGGDGKPSLTVAETPGCGKPDAADSPNSEWGSCGRPLVFDASTHDFVLGTKPTTEEAEDR